MWVAYFPKGPVLTALSPGEDLAPCMSLFSLGVLSFLLSVNPTGWEERGVCVWEYVL